MYLSFIFEFFHDKASSPHLVSMPVHWP